MQLAVSEVHGSVMLKLHLYGRQKMAVTEFQNGVGDQIIQQHELYNENFRKFRKIN